MAKYQPAPDTPATSASAWNALLRAHQGNVQPTIERWRGTLDTLLVFVSSSRRACGTRCSMVVLIADASQVALFSAIVTTFFVQSLTNLSQDPDNRTNELLENLTEIVLSIGHGNLSSLKLDEPENFVPEGNAVRLNFYWSIALMLSVGH